ncbi:DMT family transporter [Actinoplanes sp. TBRC 11911]|uniref:DMT family transporter n=1 Tax=Actinoplanes sp. TBRC 11911 TaxID=2729386 RepID=UPI00145D2666|nr:DMT family transporter [Actinoplanes sp. TBRC 11911]NMO55582.1 DMT family transporter [Actinoplanes sp. TBRC 11911]
MGALFWAVALSVLSAASYAAAAIAQERLAEHGQRGLARWAVALLLTVGGVALHLVALNFGTVAVVQALGTLTLLFALPIAVIRYKTKISAAGWVDAILTVAGLAVILSLSVESDEPALLSDSTARYLSVITLATVLVLTVASWPSGPRLRAVLLAGAAGVAFGIGSVMSKAILGEITEHGLSSVSWLVVGVVVLLSGGGYLLGQLSYQGAGLAAPLATVSVSNPVVAATAGIVVFDESFRHGLAGDVIVAVAAVVMTLGVIGLSRRSAAPAALVSSAEEKQEDRVIA